MAKLKQLGVKLNTENLTFLYFFLFPFYFLLCGFLHL